ncbi:Wzz/FepE/Etk N-terminal domain-containing protein [Lipingzhangella sp. LS1_29]|uniref:Wzz/FepE/Etk N-terminal domain-containing protein n=1 Tax=Lipingzhangella rawalii TaxID=2055835 RepID=A0ABU2H3B9_9ACTN|nr:Wzz/FepE/Etk N-terminal domain-containing protein [Lipingzhangella rawalii]MDS1269800.1 Wzz/FepE/Etk N-terminal domain-containing protein [Lipingzhangella rawalii]
MPESATGDPLAAYTDVLRRHWRLIAVLTTTGLLLAGAALLVVPRTYTATTAVQVHPTGVENLTGEAGGRTNGEVNLDTEAQVVRSATVTADALRLLDRDPAATDVHQARERLEVTVPPNSSVLEISYAAEDPGTARDISLAFAEAYLEHRASWTAERVEERLAGLDAELESKYAQLSDEQDEATDDSPADTAPGAPAPTREETLHAEIETLHEQRTPLAAVNEELSAGSVLTQATAPPSPSAPRAELWLVAGSLLGLVAGLALSYARHRSRPAPDPHNAAPVPAQGSRDEASPELLDGAAESSPTQLTPQR